MCGYNFENIIRSPDTIRRKDCIPISRLSGRYIDSSMPRPADNRHIPMVNESFLMVGTLFLSFVILYAECKKLDKIPLK